MKRADWLVEVLREAGVDTRGYPGWSTRGRSFADLWAVVWHHDASPKGDSPGVPEYMLRQMAAGKAAAQLWVDRYGRWHILASGVAFHAGNVRHGCPGNGQSLGVETDHTTGEAWPQVQVDSLRRGSAAILRRLGQDETGLHMHKTICDPVGRKVDPDGLDLEQERLKVRELLRVKAYSRIDPQPLPTITEDDDMYRLLETTDTKRLYSLSAARLDHIETMDQLVGMARLGAFRDLDSAGNPTSRKVAQSDVDEAAKVLR